MELGEAVAGWFMFLLLPVNVDGEDEDEKVSAMILKSRPTCLHWFNVLAPIFESCRSTWSSSSSSAAAALHCCLLVEVSCWWCSLLLEMILRLWTGRESATTSGRRRSGDDGSGGWCCWGRMWHLQQTMWIGVDVDCPINSTDDDDDDGGGDWNGTAPHNRIVDRTILETAAASFDK